MVMAINQIKVHLESDKIQKIKLAGFDIDGVMRGKYISLDNFFLLSKKAWVSVM